MEQSEPMDRLVCGDVGFGKTEVAMRAAFRAVLDGKQVALLCPTTVLAEQHYQNFKSRMQGFPVNVGMLSRFVPKARQQQVVRAAGRGAVDILIGTHRLLSKDVEFANLGLLILDEEQRFGVKHKEKLKELRRNIDALTLTATPIPRTLQLSLSGIRGLSTIETAPPERKTVETALVERDDEMLAHVLDRELARGGQVFWVHNRVKSLEAVEQYVKRLAPRARVGMAHGQMSERLLEETMHRFWHGELDVLVCTAIIESGLDFPGANTLVVDQAQLFGLGQLYQLRGRVGRADKQAYAYFVVPSLDGLTEIARKRMRVVLDMDYLGAGFQVAMEDLRLRGAGNILGEAQSGQMAKVGLDLFLEMLEEEVRRMRGEAVEETVEPEVNFAFEARIPESYIPEATERLRHYRSLSSASGSRALDEELATIKDLYGHHLPPEVDNFIAVLRLKSILSGLQIVRADLFTSRAVLTFAQNTRAVSPERLVSWLQSRQSWAKLAGPDRLEIRFPEDGSIVANLDVLGRELSLLTDTEASETDAAVPRGTA
jgi:transcription-repair coupling factor (superfamily II helicase)